MRASFGPALTRSDQAHRSGFYQFRILTRGPQSMIRVVSDKPYEFVPPHYGHFWPWLLNRFAGYYNRRTFGLFDVQYRDLQRLETL